MSNNKFKLLVVEDENSIRNFIQTFLEANGYQVITAATYRHGLMMFSSHIPDLIMLDLGLPDADGLEMIKYVRQTSSTPIIVLSARTEETDKVAALDYGANDYITKPFGTAELLARVRATLRNKQARLSGDTFSGNKYVVDDMTIDYDKRQITISDVEVKLTQTEYNIVSLLSEHPGKVLTYANIIKIIWGASDMGCIKKLQVNMANIRKKLGEKPGDNRYIINELGVGYRMRERT